MQHGIQQKKDGVQTLVEKRKLAEDEQASEEIKKTAKKSRKATTGASTSKVAGNSKSKK